VPDHREPDRPRADLDPPTGVPDAAEPADGGGRGRRTLLAAGATAAVGALGIAMARPAQAAAGRPMVLGRANSAGSSLTTLSCSNIGSAFYVRASAGNGAFAETASNARWGVRARNLSRSSGAGGGLVAEGGVNNGAYGTTNANSRFGVVGRNASGTVGTGAGVRAEGRRNVGLFADTLQTVTNVAAIVALGGDGEANGIGLISGGTTYLDGNALALRSFVGVLDPVTSELEYAPVTSGELAYHTITDKVTLDGSGAATVTLPAPYRATVDMRTLRIGLTPVGAAMSGMYATYTEGTGTTSFGIVGGANAGTVHYTVSAERISLTLAGAASAPAAAAGAGTARGTAAAPSGAYAAPRRAAAASTRVSRGDVAVPRR
jgi:hypothetical protein